MIDGVIVIISWLIDGVDIIFIILGSKYSMEKVVVDGNIITSQVLLVLHNFFTSSSI